MFEICCFFFFKQKTAYEMRISDWSSDVCSSDLCGMDVLVEVHDGDEFDRALKLKSRLIGINNRNLKTFDVDLDRTIELAARAPEDATLVSASGLSTRPALDALAAHGIHCFLIREALTLHPAPAPATTALLAPSFPPPSGPRPAFVE